MIGGPLAYSASRPYDTSRSAILRCQAIALLAAAIRRYGVWSHGHARRHTEGRHCDYDPDCRLRIAFRSNEGMGRAAGCEQAKAQECNKIDRYSTVDNRCNLDIFKFFILYFTIIFSCYIFY